MVTGSLTKFVPAQAVTVKRGTEELLLVHDVKITRTHAITRTNTRGGPVDTFAWRMQELEILVLLTADLQTLVAADNVLSSRSVFPSAQTYNISGQAIDGASNVNDGLPAVLVDYDYLAPESGEYNARMKLRVTGTVS